jgi:hypothetical protein
MKISHLFLLLLLSLNLFAQKSTEKLSYHLINTDSEGNLLSWYDHDPGKSYDHIISLVWNFWDTIRTDLNGLPYHMNHQVWKKDHNDSRGIGGDQISMALSSWRRLYAYTGNERILDNMRFMTDYYLSHSLSSPDCKWKNLPYPYNTLIYSGIYDGDMILGKGFTQPDKAGSFGYELINSFKLTGKTIYLGAAVDIANTLSEMMIPGDNDHSPLPFRVNTTTGKTGVLGEGTSAEITYSYTSNWTPTMKLFNELIALGKGDNGNYQKSLQILLDWMKQYPLKTNKWGPFFEDVGTWSDTQTNAISFAQYILENPQQFPGWKESVKGIFDWVYKELGNPKWEKLGVAVVNEQTSYRVPGNSHTARQGAAELLYASKTGDGVSKEKGIRQLNWATYMVNDDGESTYPNNETWMTDGYGDFVRHYLCAMEAFPELAPSQQNHLVSSSSSIKRITYGDKDVQYDTFDNKSVEILRLKSKPITIKIREVQLMERNNPDQKEFWEWRTLVSGGILKIVHQNYNKIYIQF